MHAILKTVCIIVLLGVGSPALLSAEYDLAILNGRVIDPETELDAVKNIGITDGRIAAVTESAIAGKQNLDAAGLIVAPGFIDLHHHGHSDESYALQVRDGVTTSFELELGVADVDAWYTKRENVTILNYGASIGHAPVRMAVMDDPGDFIPIGDAKHKAATEPEIAEITHRLEKGLDSGAAAVGIIIQLTPGASRWEILEVFRLAARYDALCYVHLRYQGGVGPTSVEAGLAEVIAATAITGVSAHVVHITSNGLDATPRLLTMIDLAQAQGLDITTELYPYTAASNPINSAMLDPGWQERLGIDYGDLQWPPTGERLTKETFDQYRSTGGLLLIHVISENIVRSTISHPGVLIGSDGLRTGIHPRSVGTFSRVLGKYAREEALFSLMDALRKMTLMPALRLEARVPAMKNKGRVQIGADADLTIFDAESVIDTATYESPDQPSTGIVHVVVNGVPVMLDRRLQSGVSPGTPMRARRTVE
jgi:N-acyl-D-aspartate/D-glutamate deacylase